MAEVASVAAQEAATKEVREVGLELNTINNAIKKIFIDGKDDGLKENTFKITVMKITGLPESAQPKINIQLSSPIESKTITKTYDPLDDDDDDDNNNNSSNDDDAAKDEGDETKDESKEAEEEQEEVKKDEENDEKTGDDEKQEAEIETVETETVEAETVEAETVETETVETETVEAVETETVENKKEEKKGGEAKNEGDTTSSSSPSNLTSNALFEGVDTSVATIIFDVSDLDIPLGTSAVYDIGPLCEIDVVGGVTKKITELAVAIVPDDADTKAELSVESDVELFEDAVSEEAEVSDNVDATTTIEESSETDVGDVGDVDTAKEGEQKEVEEEQVEEAEDKVEEAEETSKEDVDTAKEGEQKEVEEEQVEEAEDKVEEAEETSKEDVVAADADADKKTEETPATDTTTPEEVKSIILPTCTLHLKIEYSASRSDQEAILKEKHNALVARRALAVENLRKITIASRRAQMAAASAGPIVKKEKPSVKPGFLNKKPKKKEPMFLIRWYDKTIGPNSLFRKVYPIAKNYILFFGGVLLMHYQGHQLALPSPV